MSTDITMVVSVIIKFLSFMKSSLVRVCVLPETEVVQNKLVYYK